jgi:hypothetical protein
MIPMRVFFARMMSLFFTALFFFHAALFSDDRKPGHENPGYGPVKKMSSKTMLR